jgi:class I fructose-bisphosphate aldolase/fructose-bisphosphate aldolase/2-amino-3,7-dideoxy-D-threo-hept-6-ulosonate synthase
MATSGKKIRSNRFHYRHSSVGMIVPIDHGLTIGPVEGLGSVSQIARWIRHPGITGVIAHKGMIERLAEADLLGSAGVMLHVNGMSTLAQRPDRKELLTSVPTALRLGADGISLQINFDGENDAHNLQMLGEVVDAASEYGLPVLTMLYDKAVSVNAERRIERLRHLMRITIELGTDSIKLAAPANVEEIAPLLDGLAEDAAIYFAGGTLCSDEELSALVRATIGAGGKGLCIGRNVFQRPAPNEILSALSQQLLRAVPPLKREIADASSLFTERAKHGVH